MTKQYLIKRGSDIIYHFDDLEKAKEWILNKINEYETNKKSTRFEQLWFSDSRTIVHFKTPWIMTKQVLKSTQTNTYVWKTTYYYHYYTTPNNIKKKTRNFEYHIYEFEYKPHCLW